MILKPPSGDNTPLAKHKQELIKIEREVPKIAIPRPKDDPATKVMRESNILPRREIILIDRNDGDEITPAEAARRAFEDQGLSFAFIANEVTQIIQSGDPLIRMRAIEFATKILANNVSGKEDYQIPNPIVNINITAHPSGGNREKNAFDILIPS